MFENWMDIVRPELAVYGISWCEGGVSRDGNTTTICGECIYFSPVDCEAIADEVDNAIGFSDQYDDEW